MPVSNARLFLLAIAALASAPAVAQAPQGEPLTVVAIPPLPTPKNATTDAGETGVIGIQIAQQIAADLRSSGSFMAIPPEKLRQYSPTEAGAPLYPNWTSSGAGALVTGYVQAREDGRLTVACYLYDLKERREMARRGFVVGARDWRRAAHRCADAFYARVTGVPGHFDTRVAYVAETGPRTAQVKRLAVMDLDGSGHRYLGQGEVTVLSPQFSPDGARIAYMSFTGGTPHVRLHDLDTHEDRPLVQASAMSFSPAFSADGRWIAFSMAAEGNTDIYVVAADGGFPRRMTTTPGTDTSPSFSPDGERIVFESDRSGSQQLYVMDSDGSSQRRISFGGATYGSPAWSPRGDLIAFTRMGGSAMQIGVMDATGRDERLVTDGWQDEEPSWAPNGRFLLFQRKARGVGLSAIYTVPLAGGEPRRLTTPQPASDPSWSGASE